MPWWGWLLPGPAWRPPVLDDLDALLWALWGVLLAAWLLWATLRGV